MSARNQKFTSSKGSRKSPKRTTPVSRANQGSTSYAPVAMTKSLGTRSIPSIQSNGSVTHIRHSEFFASVTSLSDAYAVQSYPCNPGVASLFPWLSQVAQRYETYKFRELTFILRTRAAATQVGTVGLVFDFDANDDAPSSQMMALSYHDKSADAPWMLQTLKLDLAQGDKLPTRYTRPGLPASNYDLKTYDLGALHVFTDGVAASANLGLLEVYYSVDLYTPQIQDGIGGRSSATAGLNATHLVGTDLSSDTEALLPFDVTDSGTLTFNQSFEGTIFFDIVGTVLSADFAPVVSASGAAAQIGFQIVNAGATTVVGGFRVRAVPGTTLKPTITATTVTGVYYYVARANYDQFS